jgi:hypothetical protein
LCLILLFMHIPKLIHSFSILGKSIHSRKTFMFKITQISYTFSKTLTSFDSLKHFGKYCGRLWFTIQCNLSKADTIGTTKQCPLYGDVRFIESLSESVLSQKVTCSCLFKYDDKRIWEWFWQNIYIVDARL